MKTYYVVHKGIKPGIYSSWNDCKKQVDKFEGAIFKKFTDPEEAGKFLINGFGQGKKPRIVTRRENDDKKNDNKILEQQEDISPKIFVYTDGSCIRQKNKISVAGYGIYIPDKNIKVSKPLLNQKITNNRAEMTAIIESFNYLNQEDFDKKICILTDSQYSMYIFNGTGERYEKNGYKNDGKDVPNIDLIKKILELKRLHNIILLKVRAHTGKEDIHSKNNEIADKLATSGALSTLKHNNNSEFKNLMVNIDTSNDDPSNDPSNDDPSNDTSNDDTSNEEKPPKHIFFKKNRNAMNVHCNFPEFTKENTVKTNELKNIKVNQLFEFDEMENSESLNTIMKTSHKGKIMKNTKLSNWFIKKI